VALDQEAVASGFNHWHHVTLAAKETADLEKQFKSGVYVLMDIKEGSETIGDEYETADEPLLLRRAEIIQWLRDNETPDPEYPPETDAALQEFINDNYMGLRYIGPQKTTRLNVVSVTEKAMFWTPQLIWFKGKCIDPMTDGIDFDDEDIEDGKHEPMPEIDDDVLRAALGNGPGLVVNSPETMERYKALVVPRKAWNWCLHCERAYPQGSYRQVGKLQMCAYQGCDGDAVIDIWEWRKIRGYNPGYPEIPELAVVYAMYGPNYVK
ncbi:MAG: hypothetical protein NTX56_05240, partial [Proteobacteria bacterium]|nr:hypothetical protein [Pseudomonadota bacterium]